MERWGGERKGDIKRLRDRWCFPSAKPPSETYQHTSHILNNLCTYQIIMATTYDNPFMPACHREGFTSSVSPFLIRMWFELEVNMAQGVLTNQNNIVKYGT